MCPKAQGEEREVTFIDLGAQSKAVADRRTTRNQPQIKKNECLNEIQV